MTSNHDSHTTTDAKPDMLSGVQTGNGIPHDKYNICGIAHAPKQKRRHFHTKATVSRQSTHSAGHILLCGNFGN